MLAQYPHGALIEVAGSALAQVATSILQSLPAQHAQHRHPGVLGLVGPGHNGKDTVVCLRHLRRTGWWCTSLEGLDTHALAALPSQLPDTGLVIDGWLGIGRSRPLAAALCKAIAVLAAWQEASPGERSILAVDLPSGLDPDRGVGDPVAVPATATLALLAPARGLFTPTGRRFAGEVLLAPLVDAQPPDPDHRLIRGVEEFVDLGRAQRPRNAHKGMLGDVVLVGGAEGTEGAVVLAAEGALALSPGKVHVLARSSAVRLPSQLMRRDRAWLRAHLERSESDRLVIGIGCGLGQDDEAQELLEHVLAGAQDKVLDADALNLLARRHGALERLAARPAAHHPRGGGGARVVLTPHPLEAARLLGISREEVESDRHAAAETLARKSRASVILKGAGTLVASPEGACDIVDIAAPALAQAGSGDVLTGVLCALLALHPGLEVHRLALAAATLHAHAAQRWTLRTGMLAGLSVHALGAEISAAYADFGRG